MMNARACLALPAGHSCHKPCHFPELGPVLRVVTWASDKQVAHKCFVESNVTKMACPHSVSDLRVPRDVKLSRAAFSS